MKTKRDIDWLRKQKKLLQEDCRLREEEIQDDIKFLQQNLGAVIIDTIIPTDHEKQNKVSFIADIAYDIIGKVFPKSGLSDTDKKSHKFLKIAELILTGFLFRSKKKKEE